MRWRDRALVALGWVVFALIVAMVVVKMFSPASSPEDPGEKFCYYDGRSTVCD